MVRFFCDSGRDSVHSREPARRRRRSGLSHDLKLESLEPRLALAAAQGVAGGIVGSGDQPWLAVSVPLPSAAATQSVENPAAPPSVTSFGQPVVGSKGHVSLVVTFDGPVNVIGAPRIPFIVRGTQRSLVYTDGAGGNTLRFAYRPRGFATSPSARNVTLPAAPRIILPAGAAITDLGGNRARSLAAPSRIAINTTRIAENEAIGAVIGTLSAVDSDGSRDPMWFTLVAGEGSADNAAFQIDGDQLEAADVFDHEAQKSYSIRVRAQDAGGLSTERNLLISVNDVNEPPAAILLDAPGRELPVNTNTNRRVRLSGIAITDDALGTETIEVSGPDAGSFEVVAGVLYLRQGVQLDFRTKSTYDVVVRAGDPSFAASEPISAGFRVTVIDVQPYAAVIADAIRAMEVRTGSETSEGLLWDMTEGNTLPGLGQQSPAWLFPTQDAWGLVSAHDSSRVQTRLLSSITSIIANATTVVDISSLTKVADGGFRDAIVEGARQAYQAGRAPVIRLLWGRTPLSLIDGDAKTLQALQHDVHQAAPGLTVVATLMDDVSAIPKQVSWNHSKIVAADGKVALVGGINMWKDDYLQSKDPVTDLAIEVSGPAALSAHRFLDVLWRYSWSYRDHVGVSIYANVPEGQAFPVVVSGLLGPAPAEGTTRILTVGRAGHIFTGKVTGTRDDQSVSPADQKASAFNGLPNPMNGNPAWDGNNPSDTALRTLVDLARDEIIISQQMMEFSTPGAVFGGLPQFDVRLFDALARRAAAGVKITIVVSGDTPTGAYTANPDYTMRVLLSRLEILLGSRAKALQAGAENVQICSFRYSNADKWPGTGLFAKPRLHNKIIAVDSAVVYVGSQNAYPNELMEFGYIVESTAAVADLKRTYLDPMVRYSSRTALPWPTK